MYIDNLYTLILAGGEGTRFAPLSTAERPKQFLNFVGEGTFLEQARRRVADLVPANRIYVATNARYVDLVKSQLGDISEQNIIPEPVKRNTAPCIVYATRLIQNRDPEGVIVVLPSDHVILDVEKFKKTITDAAQVATRSQKIVTLGITPRWAATEYGYIKAGRTTPCADVGAYDVERFVEKPDIQTARNYLDEGGYYWNSGMFIWTAKALLSEVAEHMPDMHELLNNFQEGSSFCNEFFTKARAISIDYGVMEKSRNVAVIPCDPGWSDVGTWEGLYNLYQSGKIAVAPMAVKTMKDVLGFVSPTHKAISLPWRIEKPWGHEEVWAHTEDYVGKILSIKAGHRLSFQYHRIKEETIRILHGIVELEYSSGDNVRVIRMKEGDVHHIPPQARHRFIAVDDCKIMEVSTPYLGDIVRLEDDYGRIEKDVT